MNKKLQILCAAIFSGAGVFAGNILPNSSFEEASPKNAALPAHWRVMKQNSSANTHKLETSIALDGKNSVRIDNLNPAESKAQLIWLQSDLAEKFKAFAPGTVLELSVYAYAPEKTARARVFFESIKAKRSLYSQIVTLTPGCWQKITLNFKKEALDYGKPYICLQLMGNGTLLFDRAYLGEKQSGQPEIIFGGNGDRAFNGNAEILDAKGIPASWQIVNRSKNGTASVDHQTAASGKTSLKLEAAAKPDNLLMWAYRMPAKAFYGLKPGQPVVLSLDTYTFGNEATFFRFYIEFKKGNKFIGTFYYPRESIRSKKWMTKKLTFKMPKEMPTSAYVYVQLLTKGKLCVDNLSFIPSLSAGRSEAAARLGKNCLFFEDFENIPNCFPGMTVTADDPGAGYRSGHLAYPAGQESDVKLAGALGFLKVEPDTWYRMKVRSRNDIKAGEIKFGIFESRSAEKQRSGFQDWRWKNIPLNITEWRDYEMEFKTASNTHGIQIFFRTENCHSGSSYWDNILIEKFTKKIDPLTLRPFRAAATFTDIPSRRAYRAEVKDDQGKTLTNFFWEDIDPAAEKLVAEYRELPENTLMTAAFIRGDKVLMRQQQKVSGSGTAEYDLKINTLPEGIYLFTCTLEHDGKVLSSLKKEIWRIDSAQSRTPAHEPVKTVSSGKNRQRLINGKIYNPIYNMTAPTSGLLFHHRRDCKPDAETYFKYMQEQFGQDLFTIWSWRGKQWDGKDEQWVEHAIKLTREYLDFLQKRNCYARISIVFSGYKRFPVNHDAIRTYIRGIKDHPAVLEYYYDEPEFRFTPAEMIKLREVIASEDPMHPFSVNLCQPTRFHEYAPASAIASYDIYPFPGASLIENRKRTAILLKAFPENAPFDSYLQMFNFDTLAMPTFDQLRATFILDRINGSNSLIAYAWAEKRQCFLTDFELQSYYRAIVSMFRRLGKVTNEGENIPLPVKSSTSYVVHRAVKHNGKTVLMLLNVSPDTPAKAEFQLSGENAVNFFDPEWKFYGKNGKFSLTLQPLESLVLTEI